MTLAGNSVYFLLPASLLRCLMRTAQSGILSMRVRRTRGAGWRTSSVRGTSRSRTSRWSRSAAASSTRRWRLVKLGHVLAPQVSSHLLPPAGWHHVTQVHVHLRSRWDVGGSEAEVLGGSGIFSSSCLLRSIYLCFYQSACWNNKGINKDVHVSVNKPNITAHLNRLYTPLNLHHKRAHKGHWSSTETAKTAVEQRRVLVIPRRFIMFGKASEKTPDPREGNMGSFSTLPSPVL